MGPQKQPVEQKRMKMGDREQQWCSGFLVVGTWKSGWKGREGRALRVLIFRGKLEVGSYAGRGVLEWGESGLRASVGEWTERRGSEQML